MKESGHHRIRGSLFGGTHNLLTVDPGRTQVRKDSEANREKTFQVGENNRVQFLVYMFVKP